MTMSALVLSVFPGIDGLSRGFEELGYCVERDGAMITVGSLFSGIGGFDLGLERAGMRVVWQVEIDDYCQRVLAKHWPDVPRYGDIRELTGSELERVELICGGFPCQPVSSAGKRLGTADPRWLWPAMARIIRVLRPRYVLVENVSGLLAQGRGMHAVLGELAASGYDAEWTSLPAAAFGAPHIRERVWIFAYPDSGGLQGIRQLDGDPATGIRPGAAGDHAHRLHPHVPDTLRVRLEEPRIFGPDGKSPERSWWPTEPGVRRVDHGFPNRVGRIAGLGNAVVPQVAEWIGRRIIEWEAMHREVCLV